MNPFLWIILIIFIILFGCFLYLQHKYSFWNDKNIKSIKPSLLLGNLNGVGYKYHYVHKLQEIYKQFSLNSDSQYCGFYIITKPVLLALELDFIKDIMDNFNCFNDRGLYVNTKSEKISNHLYNLNCEKWKVLKPKLSTIFMPSQMELMINSFTYIGDELKSVIKKSCDKTNEKIDIKDLCLRFSSDIIGAYALNLDSNAIRKGESNLMSIAKNLFSNKPLKMIKYFIQNSYPTLSRLIGLRNYDADVEVFFDNILQKTLSFRKVINFTARADFLTLLLQIKQNGMIDDVNSAENLGTFEKDELVTQIFMLFFDGINTLSSTISFCLFELALNQNVQQKVRLDIRKSLDKNGGKLTYAAIQDMHYLKQVVYETIRKYSPVHTIYRRANQRYPIPHTDYSLNEDLQIIIPVYAIHHDPKIYPDPEMFDPDRFLPENIKKRHTHSFLAFGHGQRSCLGSNFGTLTIQMGLAMMLSEFRYKLNPLTKSSIVFDPKNISLDSIDKIWLDVENVI